jgi:hypothetical protein
MLQVDQDIGDFVLKLPGQLFGFAIPPNLLLDIGHFTCLASCCQGKEVPLSDRASTNTHPLHTMLVYLFGSDAPRREVNLFRVNHGYLLM